MSSDMYTALSGATSAWAQMEVVANNIANASTVGYKAARVTFKAEGPEGEPLGEVYASSTEARPDLSDGALKTTGNPHDLALQGDGFFSVQTGTDGYLLTRDGRFHLNEDGHLVTEEGHALLGRQGPIQVPPGETIQITEDGHIVGNRSGRFDQVRVETGIARPIGRNMWKAVGGTKPGSARVVQGALEASNVNAMRSMVELMEASRYIEAYRKAMETSDQLNTRANRIGGR